MAQLSKPVSPWPVGPAFELIQSPLSSNPALREILDRLDAERPDENRSGEPGFDEELDRHADRESALADYLTFCSYDGTFERRDFEASFLNDERVKNLYDSAKHPDLVEFILEDIDKMLEDIALAEADPGAVPRFVLHNLKAVLRRLPGLEAADALEAVDRLLTH